MESYSIQKESHLVLWPTIKLKKKKTIHQPMIVETNQNTEYGVRTNQQRKKN